MKTVLKAILLLAAVALAAAVVFVMSIGSRVISAKAQPGRLETTVARAVRHTSIPRRARELSNPIAQSPDVLAEAMAHYADHCAICHANNGSGDTEVGRGLYPKPPDMRLAPTQNLSDGELFWIIENGVRFTGMPAWSTGTKDGETASWHLVHFVRRLPKLTADEITQMESLNPKPPAEIKQEMEEEEFLKGGPPPSTSPVPHKHQGEAK